MKTPNGSGNGTGSLWMLKTSSTPSGDLERLLETSSGFARSMETVDRSLADLATRAPSVSGEIVSLRSTAILKSSNQQE